VSVDLTKLASRVLRLNVGFLLKEGIGFSRDFVFDEPVATFGDELTVHDLTGTVNLTRTPQGLYVQGRLRGTIDHQCSRCLKDMAQPVSARLAELYHYPPENAPLEALTISDDVHLDLTPVVREDLLLSVPIQALCKSDCKGLCPDCGTDWNEGPCDCPSEEIDPRWAGLAALLEEPPTD